jgi:hypothetical protein
MLRHIVLCSLVVLSGASATRAEGDWEITSASELALERGLDWLAHNQGSEGNWESNDLGLVSMGALAFLSAGHAPGRGKYGLACERALDFVLKNAKPSGLLNISNSQRDMYNHGLSCFVLGQAHGMTGDPRISPVLDRALKLIATTQCADGGWDYHARSQRHGHDLSLAVMQAKALRSAVDSGLEVPPEVIELAIKSVREHYRSKSGKRHDDPSIRDEPGQFTYDGGRGTLAMAACGVVCLQEFGQYDDWRIGKNMDLITAEIGKLRASKAIGSGNLPLDAYTLYYVGQALYQVGGKPWEDCYPILRDHLVASQSRDSDPRRLGVWRDTKHLGGKPAELYGTAVGCFILAIPNRYLPILQEGKIENLRGRFQGE